MPGSSVEFSLQDAAGSDALGVALARHMPSLHAHRTVLYLEGDLGAGKTTCARSLLRALGVTGLIRSPTYALIEVYKLDAAICIHLDLYRLQSAGDVEDLGLREYDAVGHLWLVEWPENGFGVLPPADLKMTLHYLEDARVANLKSCTARGAVWLEKLAHDTRLTRYVSHLT